MLFFTEIVFYMLRNQNQIKRIFIFIWKKYPNRQLFKVYFSPHWFTSFQLASRDYKQSSLVGIK